MSTASVDVTVRDAFKTGIGFGLTSGIITTVGLIVGLHAGTQSKIVVIGGVLSIAIADAFSDALGIHVAQESQGRHSTQAIWEATCATFVSKLLVSFTFIVPLALLANETAIAVSVAWGMLLLVTFNFYMARAQHVRPWPIVAEHAAIALCVIVLAHIVGDWVQSTFG